MLVSGALVHFDLNIFTDMVQETYARQRSPGTQVNVTLRAFSTEAVRCINIILGLHVSGQESYRHAPQRPFRRLVCYSFMWIKGLSDRVCAIG